MTQIRWKLSAPTIKWRLDSDATVEALGEFGPVNPGSTVLYYSDHVREDGFRLPGGAGSTVRTLGIEFDFPAESDGTITYAVTGTAVADTHYHISTPNPVPFNAGAQGVDITIELLDSGSWFKERSIIVTLTGADGLTLSGQLEYRLWVRPVDSAPTLTWLSASSSGLDQVYNLHAQIDAASQEQVNIYYDWDTTLIEGTDFRILTDSGDGFISVGNTRTNQAGSNRIQWELLPAGAAKTGSHIDFYLSHEPVDGSRRNWWTNTGSWKPEGYNKPFPGEPSTHSSGGGDGADPAQGWASGNIIIGQDEVNDPETGLPFWSIPSGNRKTRPDGGAPMQAILMRPEADSNYYIRESFEAETFAGCKAPSAALKRYNLAAVYVDTIPAPEAGRNSQFVAITFRNRPKDTENRVVFWRASDGNDATGAASVLWSNGSQVQTVTTDTGVWGYWTSENLHPDDEWGVEEETIDGTNYTRLWYMHNVPDAGYDYVNNKGETKKQIQGDLQNILMRFTYFSSIDNSGTRTQSSSQIVGGKSVARGTGMLVWGPTYHQSDTAYPNPPTFYHPDADDQFGLGRYWPRHLNFEEPWGNAYTDSSSGYQHRFTVG